MESSTKKEPVNKKSTGTIDTVSTKKVFGDMIKFALLVVLLILIFVIVYAPINQIFYWLKYGVWWPSPASSFLIRILPTSVLLWLSEPSWIGLKNILFWILNLHISIFLIPFLIFGGYLYGTIDNILDNIQSQTQTADRKGNFKKPKDEKDNK